jgi:hypothetical protein
MIIAYFTYVAALVPFFIPHGEIRWHHCRRDPFRPDALLLNPA